MSSLSRILSLSALSVVLSACGSTSISDYVADQQVEYKRERQAEQNLEIPPDLTTTRINDRMAVPDTYSGVGANYSEYMADRKARGADGGVRLGGGVLPQNPAVDVLRDGDQRWLAVEGNIDALWDRVIGFWEDQGILLVEQNPDVGIMRTSWIENRANLSTDFITDTLRSVLDGLYDTGLRDQYRLRFERIGEERTEIYLTHYGMQEVLQDTGGRADTTIWTQRERDPELEVVMLNRLMVFLGSAEDRAKAKLNAQRTRGAALSQLLQDRDGVKLVIGDQFPRAWRLVGLSLDRVGFAVEDRDRSKGLFYVRYNDPAAAESVDGLLDKLKFWEDEPEGDTQYQIKVAVEGERTEVTVLDSLGQRDKTDTAKRILNLLQEQIR